MIMLEDVGEQTPEQKAKVIRNNRITIYYIKKYFYKIRRKIKHIFR